MLELPNGFVCAAVEGAVLPNRPPVNGEGAVVPKLVVAAKGVSAGVCAGAAGVPPKMDVWAGCAGC